MSGRNLINGLPADAQARVRNRAQPKWVAPMLATLTDTFRDEDDCLSRNGMGSAALLFTVVAIKSLFAESNSAEREIPRGEPWILARSMSGVGLPFLLRTRRGVYRSAEQKAACMNIAASILFTAFP
jgi:hypothetical protein